jgi:hypothetical protein
MLLPAEMQPTDVMQITLPRGTVAQLPLCRPIFSRWTGAPLNFDFGGKPALNYDQEVCFAELAILRTLLKHDWSGVWVEAFGGTHFLNTMPKSWSLRDGHVSIPAEKEAILKRIWQTSGTTAASLHRKVAPSLSTQKRQNTSRKRQPDRRTVALY